MKRDENKEEEWMTRVHKTHFRPWVCAATIVLFLVFPLCNAQAALTFDMSVIFNGNELMSNSPPWVNITFVDVSDDTVDMTITAVGLSLADGEKLGEVYLNLDSLLNPTQLVFSDMIIKSGIFVAPGISKGIDLYQANGDGKYDILIEFNTDGPNKAFNGGDSVKYTITLASLTADSFDFISAPDGGVGEYKTAAHIMSPGGHTGKSDWITTPEPTTIALLGLGALGLLRKRRA